MPKAKPEITQPLSIFFAWSGDMSKKVADALALCLKEIFPSVNPWISAHSIELGKKGTPELLKKLRQCDVGILCFTEQNITSTWIAFEAGALLKESSTNRIIPFLFNVEPDALSKSPFEQFQGARSDQAGTLQLVNTINRALAKPLYATEEALKKVFPTSFWPMFSRKFSSIDQETVGPIPDVQKIINDLTQVTSLWNESLPSLLEAIESARLLKRELKRPHRAMKNNKTKKGISHAK